MGTNGDVNMTNLKIATGIADNRLSAHHPDGAGSTTSFGMFFIHGFDTAAGFNSWDPDNRTLRPGDQFSLWMLPPSGNSQVTENVYGDEYVIRVSMVQDGASLTVNLSNNLILIEKKFETVPADPNISGTTGLEIVVEATADGTALVNAKWNDGGINSDVPGYDDGTSFEWTGTIEPAPLVLDTASGQQTVTAGEIEITYEFSDGKANYDINIERRERPDDSTNPGDWSSFTSVFTTTHSSTGLYTELFTGLDPAKEYEHRITVTDALSDSVSGTTRAISPDGTI